MAVVSGKFRGKLPESCLFVVTALCLLVNQISGQCRFPRFMQTDEEPWVSDFSPGRRFIAYIHGNQMKVNSCESHSCSNYERRCLERIGDDKYMVSHREQRQAHRYMCIQFVQRSEGIVQLRLSKISMERDNDLCDDNRLVLNHWPLVSMDHFYKQRIICPFTGGYSLTLRQPDGSRICPDHLLPMRLESECEDGEGITLNFRYQECIESLINMQVKQRLYCMAQWTEGGHTFVILRHQAKLDVWCLRITGSLDDIRDAHLFLDFVCDPGQKIILTDRYLTLSMERFVVSEICADEFGGCSDFRQFCKTDISPHCPKSCGNCDSESIKLCTFPESLRGSWLLSTRKHERFVNISYYSMSVDNIGTFQCVETGGKHLPNRRVLLQIFDNGCYPRYVCVDIAKPSPSVIEYRMGKSIEWPLFHHKHIKSHVCKNDNFMSENQLQTLHPRPTEKPMKILVNVGRWHSVPCDLPVELGSDIYFTDKNNCGGCLIYRKDNALDKMDVIHTNCTKTLTRTRYTCLASFKFGDGHRAVITRSYPMSYLCWIFTWQNTIYQLPAADCSNTTTESEFGGMTNSLSSLHLMKDIAGECRDVSGVTLPASSTMSTSRVATIPASTQSAVNAVVASVQSRTSLLHPVFSLYLLSLLVSWIVNFK